MIVEENGLSLCRCGGGKTGDDYFLGEGVEVRACDVGPVENFGSCVREDRITGWKSGGFEEEEGS